MSVMGRVTLVLMVGLSAVSVAQNLPAGTHSVDDHSREKAVAARIASAENALEKKDYRVAETMLKQLAVERPKDAQVWYDLGFAQERLNEDDEAAKAYAAAVAADPNMADAQASLGLLDARHNRMEAARQELMAVGRMETAAPELRGRMLRILASMDEQSNPSLASDEMLLAIKLTGEKPEDSLAAGEMALKAGDFPAAEGQFVKVLAADPASVDARVGLGAALRSEGKFADAETTLELGFKTSPESTVLTTTLADVYMRDGKNDQAVSLIEGLRARDAAVKSNVLVTEMLARMYALAGRNAEAELLYREVVATRANDPQALDALGSVLVKETKYADAVRVLAKAVTMRAAFHDDAAWGEAASHLAFAASRDKQPELVLQALAARATVLPNSPTSLFLEATAHDSLHQFKDASRLYKEFLAASGGKFPDEEFEARHRLVALQHEK